MNEDNKIIVQQFIIVNKKIKNKKDKVKNTKFWPKIKPRTRIRIHF